MTTGLALRVDDGDLVFADRELVVLAGLPSLLQALRLRVLTPLGDDRYDTRYGLDTRAVFTGPHGARATRDVLRLNLVRTVGTDPRVREIREVQVSDDAASRRGRAWTAEVVLVPAEDGAPTALTLEVGV